MTVNYPVQNRCPNRSNGHGTYGARCRYPAGHDMTEGCAPELDDVTDSRGVQVNPKHPHYLNTHLHNAARYRYVLPGGNTIPISELTVDELRHIVCESLATTRCLGQEMRAVLGKREHELNLLGPGDEDYED